MQCYRHPKIETNLACGRCERPICTKCMVTGPAGTRCPECASLKSSHLYKVPAPRVALAIVLGVFGGTIGAFVMLTVSFFVFFIGPAYGAAIAELVLRATGRKRGQLVEVIGVGSIVLGALIVLGMQVARPLIIAAKSGVDVSIGGAILSVVMASVWPLIGIALAISACYSKLKYF